MSRQLYFFASNRDEEEILEALLSVLGSFYFVPDRGDRITMTPKLISSVKEMSFHCKFGKILIIIKEQYLDLFQLENLQNDLFVVNRHSFPCLEYCRSIEVDEKTLGIGRFAYFYEHKHFFASDVQKIFRKIKKESEKLSEKIPHRIFSEASQRYELLLNVGMPIKNPKFQLQLEHE